MPREGVLAGVDEISVGALYGRETGMKAIVYRSEIAAGYVARQQLVEPVEQLLAVAPGYVVEMAYHGARVHAGVGPSGSRDVDLPSQYLCERVLQPLLHRHPVWLYLPSVIGGAIEAEREKIALGRVGREADVGTVVERHVAVQESLRSLELAYVVRVCVELPPQFPLALLQRGAKEGVTVGGEHDVGKGLLARRGSIAFSHVHLDDLYAVAIDRVAVYHGIRLVFFLHRLHELRQHAVSRIVVHQFAMVYHVGMRAGHGVERLGPFLGNEALARLAVGVELPTHDALAVANHPHLMKGTAEDHGGGAQAVYRGHRLRAREAPLDINVVDGLGDALAEVVERSLGIHVPYVIGNHLHAKPAVALFRVHAPHALAGAAVYDGHEVGGCHYPVFATCLIVLSLDELFSYNHLLLLVLGWKFGLNDVRFGFCLWPFSRCACACLSARCPFVCRLSSRHSCPCLLPLPCPCLSGRSGEEPTALASYLARP